MVPHRCRRRRHEPHTKNQCSWYNNDFVAKHKKLRYKNMYLGRSTVNICSITRLLLCNNKNISLLAHLQRELCFVEVHRKKSTMMWLLWWSLLQFLYFIEKALLSFITFFVDVLLTCWLSYAIPSHSKYETAWSIKKGNTFSFIPTHSSKTITFFQLNNAVLKNMKSLKKVENPLMFFLHHRHHHPDKLILCFFS